MERTLVRAGEASFRGICGKEEDLAEFWGAPGYTYIGYPTSAGSGSSCEIDISLGISPQCRKEFLLYAFSRILNDSFPGNVELLRSEPAAYRTGERFDWDGEVPVLDQADEDKLWGLLNSITLPGSMGSTLEAILRGETAKYFAGDCTVEQAAQRIQTRASLYLSER